MAFRSFSSKPKCVMLNAARLDFDGRMDWSKVTNVTEFTSFDISSTEEIVPRAQGMDIVMNKELQKIEICRIHLRRSSSGGISVYLFRYYIHGILYTIIYT
jgi:hypothetical protein